MQWTVLLVGMGVVGLTAFLPIDDAVVRRNTLQKLTREALSELRPEGAPPNLAVQLTAQAEGVDAATVRAQLQVPAVAAEGGGFAPPFRVVEGAPKTLQFTVASSGGTISVAGVLGDKTVEKSARLGNWVSLLPPLVAIILAIAVRQVLIALFGAVFVGASFMQGGPLTALWVELKGLAGAVSSWLGSDAIAPDGYLGGVLADTFNLQILGFTFALVGLIAVVGRMGGTRGLVIALSRFAKGPRSAQVMTSLMGTAVFFDDYANTVVVGTTARSLTDGHKVSREKLAYIVDSTSAPVAGVAIISTWIGYEVGLFDDLLGSLSAVTGLPSSGYEVFFAILPMRFYCFFALALVFMGAWLSRDLGPMYTAERRVREGGPVVPEGDADGEMGPLEKAGVTPRALNAIVPIGFVLAMILGWILWVGARPMPSFSLFALSDWKVVFDTAADDISFILLCAALSGSVVAIALAIGQRLLTVKESAAAYLKGLETLAEAALILILAWSIKSVCDDLGTGMAMVALVGDAVPVMLLPVAVFILSGAVAFSTGTSWGTMALVLPVAGPLAATLSGDATVVLMCLGAVLDGAIWGDHCSPISDTTVLSSTATGCPHLAHVRTQLPYATLGMVAAGGAGYLGTMAGLPIWLAYVVGLALMAGVLLVFGRDPNRPPRAAQPAA
jgi:Na+/H+ antiporter NhaC